MKKKNKKKLKFKINNLLIFLSLIASIYLIYNILLLKGIETFIRIILIIILLSIDLYFYRKNIKLKKKKNLFIFLMITYIISNLFLGSIICKVYNKIDNINKDKITYSSYLVSLNNSTYKSIDDCINLKIGLLDVKNNIDNYVIPMEIIEDKDLDSDN